MKNFKIKAGFFLACLAIGLPGYALGEKEEPQENHVLLPDMMKQKSDLTVFTKLLQETGWADSLMLVKDESYVPVQNPPLTSPLGFEKSGFVPQERPFAFTVFAESDSVFSSMGITDAASLTAYLQEHYADDAAFSGLIYDDQYTRENHAANRFVAYHLLAQKLNPQQLVYHYNEIDFELWDFLNTGEAKATAPIYDYYTTMGTSRRLIKLYESKDSEGVRINRFVTYDPDLYREGEVLLKGLSVSKERMYEALNGNVYLLKDMLLYDDQLVEKGYAQERLRFDVASLSPELMNLGYRRLLTDIPDKAFYMEPDYLEKIKVLAGDLYYLTGFQSGWSDYQGDEYLLVAQDGQLDIILELPPVAVAGTYQLRLALSGNPSRSVVQYYVGEGNALAPAGLPVDERTSYMDGYFSYGRGATTFVNEDLVISQGGHMRAPGVYGDNYSSGIMNYTPCGRRIVGNFYMDPAKKYYFRIKSAGDLGKAQLFLDYLELVPSTVFNHPSKTEDCW